MEKLGINAFQLLAQGVNFAILMLVLKKFLYAPVLKLLEKRRQQIEEQVGKDEAVIKKLAALEEKEKDLMMKAKLKSDDLIKEARREARKTSQAILDEAAQKAVRERAELLENARGEIDRMKSDFEKIIAKEATKLANDALRTLLDSKVHVKLTESQIAKLIGGK